MNRKEPIVEDVVVSDSTVVVRMPCPGVAHRTGGVCMVCDPSTDGSIDVLVTEPERESLLRAARGLPFDKRIARRLMRIGLLLDVCGLVVLAPVAHELLRGARLVN